MSHISNKTLFLFGFEWKSTFLGKFLDLCQKKWSFTLIICVKGVGAAINTEFKLLKCAKKKKKSLKCMEFDTSEFKISFFLV